MTESGSLTREIAVLDNEILTDRLCAAPPTAPPPSSRPGTRRSRTTLRPRLLVASTQQNGSSLSAAIDLMKDDARDIEFPGQAVGRAFFFEQMRGYFDSALEGQVLSAATGQQAVTFDTVTQALAAQGGQLVLITQDNLNVLDGLSLSADAKARITQEVESGMGVVAPSQMVTIDGQSTVEWLQVNFATGQVISVAPNGAHQAAIEYAFELDNPLNVAAAAFIGTMEGFAVSQLKFIGLFLGGITSGKDLEDVVRDAKLELATDLAKDYISLLAGAIPVPESLPEWEELGAEIAKSIFGLAGQGRPVQSARGRRGGHQAHPGQDPARLLQPVAGFRCRHGRGLGVRDLLHRDDPPRRPAAVPGPDHRAGLRVAPELRVRDRYGRLEPLAAQRLLDDQHGQPRGHEPAHGLVVLDGRRVVPGLVAAAPPARPSPMRTGRRWRPAASRWPWRLRSARPCRATISTASTAAAASPSTARPGRLIGVCGDWASYTATVTGDVSITLTTAGLTLDGTALPAGTYTITTSSATLAGSGPSTVAQLLGLGLDHRDERYDQPRARDRQPLRRRQAARSPNDERPGRLHGHDHRLGQRRRHRFGLAQRQRGQRPPGLGHPGDAHDRPEHADHVRGERPDQPRRYLQPHGQRPARLDGQHRQQRQRHRDARAGLQSGTYPIQIIAQSQTDSNLVAQTTVEVTITPTQPGINFTVASDPLSPCRSTARSSPRPSAPRSRTSARPPIPTTSRSRTSPAASRSTTAAPASRSRPARRESVGIYLVPNTGQPIPPPGTQLSFTVTATSTTDSVDHPDADRDVHRPRYRLRSR